MRTLTSFFSVRLKVREVLRDRATGELTIAEINNYLQATSRFWILGIPVFRNVNEVSTYLYKHQDRLLKSDYIGDKCLYRALENVCKVLNGADKWEVLGTLIFPKRSVVDLRRQLENNMERVVV